MYVTDWILAVSAFASLTLAGIAFWTILRASILRKKQRQISQMDVIYKWAEEGNMIFQPIRFQHHGDAKGNILLVNRLLELYRKRKHIEPISTAIGDDTFQDIVKTTASSLERYVEQTPDKSEEEFDFAKSAEECSAFFATLSWVTTVRKLRLEE